jgi:hypothetical protein
MFARNVNSYLAIYAFQCIALRMEAQFPAKHWLPVRGTRYIDRNL